MNGFEYVADLSIEDKILFLKMIIRLIGYDNKIDEHERSFVKELARQYKIPGQYWSEINEYVDENELLNAARQLERKKALYLIKELLMVANTDNDFDEREIDFVVKVSEATQIESTKVTDINRLVLDQMALIERYHDVMEFETD